MSDPKAPAHQVCLSEQPLCAVGRRRVGESMHRDLQANSDNTSVATVRGVRIRLSQMLQRPVHDRPVRSCCNTCITATQHGAQPSTNVPALPLYDDCAVMKMLNKNSHLFSPRVEDGIWPVLAGESGLNEGQHDVSGCMADCSGANPACSRHQNKGGGRRIPGSACRLLLNIYCVPTRPSAHPSGPLCPFPRLFRPVVQAGVFCTTKSMPCGPGLPS